VVPDATKRPVLNKLDLLASPASMSSSALGHVASRGGVDIWEKLFIPAILLFLFQDVVSGVSRYVFSLIGHVEVNYIPSITVLIFCLVYVYLRAASLSARFVVISSLFMISVIYSLFVGRSLFAVGFAIYTWTAFFVGVIVIERDYLSVIIRYVWVMWCLAVSGVFLNVFTSFPWVGSEYEVFGQLVSSARDWNTFGIQRLSGFSRGSFAVSNQIAIYAALLCTLQWSRTLKFSVWSISAVAIALTTSKTPFIFIVIWPVFIFALATLRRIRASLALRYIIGTLTVLELAVVLPPFVGSVGDVGNTSLDLPDALSFIRLESLADRALYMWPDAFALMRDYDLTWLFGRGVGGIGAAQAIDEVGRFNAADNLFLFLLVTFGIQCLTFFILVMLGWKSWFRNRPDQIEKLYALSIAVLILGTLTNVVESIPAALAFGAIVWKGIFRPSRPINEVKRLRASLS
jgi:hypothetical protein